MESSHTCCHCSAHQLSPTRPAHLSAEHRVAACRSLLRTHLDLHTWKQPQGQQQKATIQQVRLCTLPLCTLLQGKMAVCSHAVHGTCKESLV